MAGLMTKNIGLLRTSNLNFALKNVSKSLKNRTIVLSTISNEKETGGIFQRLWDSVDVSAPVDAHSKTLTDDNSVTYEIICKYIPFFRPTWRSYKLTIICQLLRSFVCLSVCYQLFSFEIGSLVFFSDFWHKGAKW